MQVERTGLVYSRYIQCCKADPHLLLFMWLTNNTKPCQLKTIISCCIPQPYKWYVLGHLIWKIGKTLNGSRKANIKFCKNPFHKINWSELLHLILIVYLHLYYDDLLPDKDHTGFIRYWCYRIKLKTTHKHNLN